MLEKKTAHLDRLLSFWCLVIHVNFNGPYFGICW